uniref:Pentacotripeptide-repeat region of PRORP domain-containing protein n=1 Tax=Oryza nivara TaxID=4536 RepID=A0A0E0IEP1_ORYNI
MGSLLLPPWPLPSPASPSARLLLPELHSPARLAFPSSPSAARPPRRDGAYCPRAGPPHADAAAALMLAHAEAGDFASARSMWAQLLHSSAAPRLRAAAPRLLPAYARLGRCDEALLVVRELCARDPGAARALYPLAVTCFGAAGELALMEDAVREMARHGLPVDSATGNAFVCHYAASGTVPQMEAAYWRLKASRLLVSVAAIRAMASAYISHRKYYKLGEFVTDVGLGRRAGGNLLWNLYLLSFAANFKMKSLQRAFLDMVAAGFTPDLTTFNLRAVAFSKMCMFWDLHLTADHMRRDGVAPDLVTHGCFVDAYLERRLARNLNFAFDRLGAGEPVVATDAVVFEAFGKGGFHASSEVLLEATGGERRWTYYKLLGVYLRKQHRKNQIFWNY